MSEDSNPSELAVEETVPAVEETTSAEPADEVKPDSISPPKKADKKKMWIVIVAIIVAAALIGTTLYVLVGEDGVKDLEAEMTPDPVPVIPAGEAQELSIVNVVYGGEEVSDDLSYSWSVDPSSLGSFDYEARANVNFIAGEEGDSGEIECVVTYEVSDDKEVSVTVTASVTVAPPFLESVNIYPSSAMISPNEEQPFGAKVLDSVENEVTDASITWSVSGLDASDYNLNSTTGPNVTFSASVEGNATLTATATDGIDTASSFVTIEITNETFSRSVDYYWYDMFGHPIGEHYDHRLANYGDEWRVTDEYPYLYMWTGAPPGNTWIYSFMRLDITGRNMTDMNMNEKPVLLPYFGDARGGTAKLDWYMDYITYEEGEAKLGDAALSWFDGWYIELMGTTTLDEQAAKAVLGISTSDQFENFDDWWATNGNDVAIAWETWMIYESTNDRLAIHNAYGGDMQFVYFDLDAEKVGDEVVVTYDTISWGGEALMFRWLREAFLETEWWMEDMTLEATIGPQRTDLDLNTAIEYGVFAYEATDPAGEACWAWEPLISDYIKSDRTNPYSAFDPYADFTYLNYAPGSEWYGEEMPWDYTPYCQNLTENETLILEWPEGEVLFFKHDIDETGAGTLVDNTIEFSENMTLRYAEPWDITDLVTIDTDARQIIYEGPFDFWTWSRDQSAYEWLASEWDKFGILPYGIPYVEFIPDFGGEVRLDLEIDGLVGPYEIGEVATFSVTAKDLDTDETYTAYDGTVSFTSSDEAAVLPADYTFVPADAGTHEFTVVFNTVDAVTHQATHTLTVVDTDDSLLSATASDILVTEPERIDRFEVTFAGGDVIANEPADFTVTAYNQWDEVYDGYVGTVNFTSDDVDAELPDNYTFVPADAGSHDFNVTFATDGMHLVNATDVDVPEASGEASVMVLPAAAADYFILTGVRDPAPLDDQPETMKVTVYDQYDREFTAYEGTVEFESNDSNVNLPSPTPFTLGESNVTVTVEFLAEGDFMLYCNDTVDSSINGTLAVTVVPSVYLERFEVTGIEDMWEDNYSDVTVEAIDNYGGTFEDYEGTIIFSSDPSSDVTLPLDYTFVPGDMGIHTFPMAVSFDEPDTYNVSVEDSVDDTKIGWQEDIIIEDLYADALVLSAPTEVTEAASFSVTVTAYHQYDEVFTEYDGHQVTFTSSDGAAVLPVDYTFVPGDNGVHEFTDALSLSTLGSQTVTVTDTADGTLTDTATINVIAAAAAWVQYKVYDMFEEPATTRFWELRWDNYGTDGWITNDTGNATMLYWPFGSGTDPVVDHDQTLIYAPYRWNITGEMLPNANVHEPEFMPVLGSTVAGAEASIYLYWNYLTQEWWDDFWLAEWGSHPDWDRLEGQFVPFGQPQGVDEGYVIGTYYNVSMNRAAAEEWIELPQSETDVAGWWSTNRASYETDWTTWIDDEGNSRLDIWAGYDDNYYVNGIIIELYEAGPDEVNMEIAHFNWGYEVLMCRWLNETGISTHQPYFEDFEMVIDYDEDSIDIEMDAVAQWSMHCNKQNESELSTGAPCAWVWEPLKIDYMPSSMYAGQPPVPISEYDPYESLTYQGWNCGSCRYGETDPAYYDAYEAAPNNFSLPDYGSLVFELPRTDVLGYYGEQVSVWTPYDAWGWFDGISGGSIDNLTALQYRGEMELGWHNLGAADFTYVDKVLTINGPFDWYDWRDEGAGVLWHGAPWIEFNVTEVSMAAAASGVPSVSMEEPVTPGASSSATSGASTVSEMLSLVSVACAVLVTVVGLAIGAARRPELQ